MASSIAAAACPAVGPLSRSAPDNTVTAKDIWSLREFGQFGASQDQNSAIGASPDGNRAAVLIRRADAATNTYCQELVIFGLDRATTPKVIRIDAQPIIWAVNIRGLLTPNGTFLSNPPKWSPDGRTIAFRVPVGDKPQVFAVNSTDGEGKILTSAESGVDDFVWAPDGQSLIYATRPGLATYEAAIERESRVGFHYDKRISPMFSLRPMIPGDLATTYRATLGRVSSREATRAEQTLLDQTIASGRPSNAFVFRADSAGRRTWLAAGNPKEYWLSPRTLTMQAGGTTTTCADPACKGQLFDVWLAKDAVIYLRREGWADSETAIYRWHPGSAPQRLFATEEALVGCDLVGERLICGREASRQPRRLWAMDIETGTQRILFDPNPEIAKRRLSRVERLRWRGKRGIESYGDLVFPEGQPPKAGFPMIVVQYRTRGFLRGAVGDEYPIFPFAARGIAVLSLEEASFDKFAAIDPASKSKPNARGTPTSDYDEMGQRRLQQSNLEAGIEAASRRIKIDMTRLGATGISDAASSAVYALANSNLFSAAALGTPVIDPSVLALGGQALQQQFHDFGYPLLAGEHDAFYRAIALIPDAQRFRLPILFQWSDTEYLGGMVAMTALEEAGVPVDLYIFPNEYHIKYQPAHRLAVYERNLDWFDFWFNRREDKDLSKVAQYARWRALRDQACVAKPISRVPEHLCAGSFVIQ